MLGDHTLLVHFCEKAVNHDSFVTKNPWKRCGSRRIDLGVRRVAGSSAMLHLRNADRVLAGRRAADGDGGVFTGRFDASCRGPARANWLVSGAAARQLADESLGEQCDMGNFNGRSCCSGDSDGRFRTIACRPDGGFRSNGNCADSQLCAVRAMGHRLRANATDRRRLRSNCHHGVQPGRD